MSDIPLTQAEQQKLAVISSLINKKITNSAAARKLGFSVRQVQRLKAGVRKNGVQSVIHKLKGRLGNHHFDLNIKQQVLKEIKQKYPDFKPKFAAEKILEKNKLSITSQTIRVWMSEEGLWKPHKQKQPEYHAWRERREYFGELEQFDGSYHYWFERRLLDETGDSQEACLLASIDDATGKITHALFDFNEGVVPVFNFWKKYLTNSGKPLGIYLDKYSTYKINHKNAVDNSELLTQFEKAMHSLNIRVITANSPQAKGRIERLFGTLQDRLVKELRLNNINTIEEGNKFLKIFVPKFNNQFSVVATKPEDMHRPLTRQEKINLSSTFSIKEIRRVNHDYTIQFKNNFYQLEQIQPVTIRPLEKITTEQRLDNSLKFSFKGKYLKYFLLPQKPKKQKHQTAPAVLTTHKPNWKPPKNHPWRKAWRG
jgi:hypothetical protein